ncbi:MMPL family transporter, partial [Actinoplanes sp. NPDC049802]|uniref:MMPL family transporter n=1 Tax=Actinoplanes sp. NPDC049802 TaxID=3154742 RepID=UPI003402BEFF
MFAGWGSRIARLRWPVLVVALVAVLGAGLWGFGVFGQLTEGGYNDPDSESARAAEVVAAATEGRSGDVIAIYTPEQGTIDDAALSKRIKERLASLPRSAVTAQTSYWDKKAPTLAAEDRSSGIAVVTLAGADDADKMKSYAEIEDSFTVPGARVQLAGGIPLAHASSERSTDDLAFAEMVSLPIVLILLLVIFGSLVAASLPVLIGGCAVLGSLGVLHLVALHYEVNSFAVNVASLLGLGMAIDYGLFMVGRFREEQAVHDTAEAVRRTVATAGRTVVFSATLLMTALAGLLLFPQSFLKSLAYGGLAAVFLAMLLSLTLLPALLAVLGPRVDRLPVRLPFASRTSTGGWERLAARVLRRPVAVAVPILIVLLVLAWPITDARFGENDERQLPAGDPSRVAVETLKADFPQFSSDGVQIVVKATGGRKPDVKAFTDAAGKVTGVTEVAVTGGNGEDVVVLTATLDGTGTFSADARQTVEDLRALPPPANTETLVGGVTARNVDSLEAIGARLPLMIGLLVGATLVLMFLAFGSILLPVKAVVMSALSLCATFGALVWIFQEGHGASLLDVTPTPLEAGIVVLMAAVVFGLSTDYEVFLLSRMVEARTRGATTNEAVTLGLSRSGRVISAAALLLIVVTGAFSLSSISTMRFIGVGMIIALVLDATVVRVLLVPSVLGLLGDASWWAPGPLRRLQERAGLAEHAGEDEPTGRHAYRPAIDGTVVARALPAAPAQAALSSSPDTVVLDYDAYLEYISAKENGTSPFGFPLPASATVALPTLSGTPTGATSEEAPSPEDGVVSPGPEAEDSASPEADAPDFLSPDALEPVSPDAPDSVSPEVSPDAQQPVSSDAADSLSPDAQQPVSSDAADSASSEADSPDFVSSELADSSLDGDESASPGLSEPSADTGRPDAADVLAPAHAAEEGSPAKSLGPSPERDPLTSASIPAAAPPASEGLPASGEAGTTPTPPEEEPITFAAVVALAPNGVDPLSADLSRVARGELEPAELAPTDLTEPGGTATPEQPDSEAIWAEVEATLAAGVEATQVEVPTLEPTFDEFGVSGTQVIHLHAPEPEQAPASAPEADDSATQAIHLPAIPVETVDAPDDQGLSTLPETGEHTSGAVPADYADAGVATGGKPTEAEPGTGYDPAASTPAHAEPEPFNTTHAEPEPLNTTHAEPAIHGELSAGTVPSDEPVGTAQAQSPPILSDAEALDPFFWRSDPRLADLTAPVSAPFSWLDHHTTPETTPSAAANPAEPDESLFATGYETSAHPDATLPHPLADRTGQRRPQTLDDWLAGRPATTRPGGSRSQAPGDVPPAVAGTRRPQTLDEWLNTTSGKTPDTEATPGDPPTTRADLPVGAPVETPEPPTPTDTP